MSEILAASNLIKRYGAVVALNGMTCRFQRGKIYGLLGPNASGKTTFMKICAALTMLYGGQVLIDGVKPGLATKAQVAYLPDGNYFPEWMHVGDTVEFFSDFFADFDRIKAEHLLRELELEKNKLITTLSKGMMARLKLAVVLSRRARLFLLDEAFDGVDPVTREKIIDIILDTFDSQSTIVLATHHIDYVDKLLDEVKLLRRGEIIREVAADEIRQNTGKSIGEYYLEVFRHEKAH
ncbi:MAG: ABC transporter ATP-binding protein YtrB [Firmicutes bacterium]|nr:ABC transporter ATP-binding protein YtrB [Bacillota bacterium]